MISYHYASPAPGKKLREDSLFTNDALGIYLIGDGLSGEDGNLSSGLNVNNAGKELETYLQYSPDRDRGEKIRDVIKEAFKKAHELSKKLGAYTTLDCLVLRNNNLYGGHIGDSSMYLIQENGGITKITKRTRSSSAGPDDYLGKAGLDVLGRTEFIPPDPPHEHQQDQSPGLPLQHVRYLFLCTDGLQIEEEEIQAAFFDEKYADKPTEILEELVRRNDALLRKNKNKEPDDLTMIIVDPYWSPTSQQEALSGLQGQIGNLESQIRQKEEDHRHQMQQQKTDHAAGVRLVRGEYEPRIRELEQTKRELNTIVTDIHHEIKSVFADLRTKEVLGTEKFSDEYVKNTPVPALLKDLLAFSSANIRNSADSEKGLRASLQDAGRRLYGTLTSVLKYFPSGQGPSLKAGLSSESPVEDLLAEADVVIPQLGDGYKQQCQKETRIITASVAALGRGIGDSMDLERLVGELVDHSTRLGAITKAAKELGYTGDDTIVSKLKAHHLIEEAAREKGLAQPGSDQGFAGQVQQVFQQSTKREQVIGKASTALLGIIKVDQTIEYPPR